MLTDVKEDHGPMVHQARAALVRIPTARSDLVRSAPLVEFLLDNLSIDTVAKFESQRARLEGLRNGLDVDMRALFGQMLSGLSL